MELASTLKLRTQLPRFARSLFDSAAEPSPNLSREITGEGSESDGRGTRRQQILYHCRNVRSQRTIRWRPGPSWRGERGAASKLRSAGAPRGSRVSPPGPAFEIISSDTR